MRPKAALIILDGFGYREEMKGNAIYHAGMEYYRKLWNNNPHTTLGAAGLDVGLPEGQMGNSEVGHLNLGAGRVVYQTYTKIDKSIEEGDFFKNEALLQAMENAKKHSSKLHLIGLLSDGGVHSHIRHFYALLEMAKKNGISEVYIHANLDGRDVPPACALQYIDALESKMKELNTGKIATVMGRYYGMDRDQRWERVQKAYNVMVQSSGIEAETARDAVEMGYERDETDEFVLPTVILENGKPVAGIDDRDSVVYVNFRPDRARQICRALGVDNFDGFEREKFPKIFLATMGQYDKNFTFPVAFPPEDMKNILSKVLSDNGLTQLRIAETEKYAHVTFFFNGQIENPFPLEERILIPSPPVPTYDMQPEMSAFEVTEKLLKRIEEQKDDVIILNFANPDMVGHTGNMNATVTALKAIDRLLERIIETLKSRGTAVLLTADHGNADMMEDSEGNTVTAHTTSRVPFILINAGKEKSLRKDGKLADVAPTLLDLLKIKKPEEMTGKSLIEE